MDDGAMVWSMVPSCPTSHESPRSQAVVTSLSGGEAQTATILSALSVSPVPQSSTDHTIHSSRWVEAAEATGR